MRKILKPWLLILLSCLISFSLALTFSTDLIIHFLDVGQADCILVQTPSGYNMLIDAGNNADAAFITSYLDNLGIKRIDVAIGTHPHEDHSGSLDTVIRRYHIGQVYMPKAITTTRTFEDVLLAAKEKALRISTAKAGISITLDPEIQMQFLAPNSDRYDDLNDYSAVLKLTYGQTSFLFTGDAEAVSEAEMLAAGYNYLSADLLKVAHHGSSSSTTEDFLRKVSPKYAVISVGADNKYGHPAPETLERLAKYGVQVLRTDQDGTIIISSDGETIRINKKASPIKPNAPPAASQTSVKEEPKPAETKEIIVYITKTGSKYHRAGCRYLKKSSIPISLKDAKAKGYSPCSACNP